MSSKNGPCPCGSGKKYKRCHGLEQSGKKGVRKSSRIYTKHSTPDLLQSLAGLTLHPANHGKNLRLEIVIRESLMNYNEKGPKTTPTELQEFLNTVYPTSSKEDLPVNLFTEVIFFLWW